MTVEIRQKAITNTDMATESPIPPVKNAAINNEKIVEELKPGP